jgi:hypothetical protein
MILKSITIPNMIMKIIHKNSKVTHKSQNTNPIIEFKAESLEKKVENGYLKL